MRVLQPRCSPKVLRDTWRHCRHACPRWLRCWFLRLQPQVRQALDSPGPAAKIVDANKEHAIHRSEGHFRIAALGRVFESLGSGRQLRFDVLPVQIVELLAGLQRLLRGAWLRSLRYGREKVIKNLETARKLHAVLLKAGGCIERGPAPSGRSCQTMSASRVSRRSVG